MIYTLQKKFIRICGIALSVVMVVIFGLILIFSQTQLNSAMDQLTNRISANGGRFPFKQDAEHMNKLDDRRFPGFITEETRYSTRYFSVRFDLAGNPVSVDLDAISSVTEEAAEEYGRKALERQSQRGWIGSFRYLLQTSDTGTFLVFVDGSMNRSMSGMTVLTVCAVIFGSFLIVFLLIIFFSKRAVKPIAESYDKQKQFITDANHELKTPMTLILANLDILESEIGQNEWLSDIRAEGQRMSDLIQQMVMLTRMDEGQKNMQFQDLDLSALLSEVCGSFQGLAEQAGIGMTAQIEPGISYSGDPNALRRLFSILLDNAVKYCDPDGQITVSCAGRKHPVIRVENSFREVGSLELERLFDRFYRGDKSRTYSGSFGIGLSIANAIVQNHRGKICAYAPEEARIGFRVQLR